jgi:hypothetical protein
MFCFLLTLQTQYRFCYKTLWDYMNMRMSGGTLTSKMSRTRGDPLYGVGSLASYAGSQQDVSPYTSQNNYNEYSYAWGVWISSDALPNLYKLIIPIIATYTSNKRSRIMHRTITITSSYAWDVGHFNLNKMSRIRYCRNNVHLRLGPRV